jgi:hypothetical protein
LVACHFEQGLVGRFLSATIKRAPLKSTAFQPFGAFLPPAIWLGWLAKSLLG